jgi:hypothetical protein
VPVLNLFGITTGNALFKRIYLALIKLGPISVPKEIDRYYIKGYSLFGHV